MTLHLGYFSSALLFAGLIALPALGYASGRLSPILTFWVAYVLTRPLGASIADWLGKPARLGGLGWGDGAVSLGLTALIAVFVGYLAVTKADLQQRSAGERAMLEERATAAG